MEWMDDTEASYLTQPDDAIGAAYKN